MSRVITLSDGPHNVSAPSWAAIEHVQSCGFEVGITRKRTDDPHILASATKAVMLEVARKGGKGMLAALEAVNVAAAPSPDTAAIRAHITGMLLDSEPDAGWTDASVSRAMLPAQMTAYIAAVDDLYVEAFSGPEA
jgi:hypothetical protein